MTAQAVLWGRPSVRFLALVDGIGLALMALGWYQVSGADSTGTQIGWLNLSVTGVLVTGLGNGMWLLRGRKSVTLLRHALLPASFAGDPALAVDFAGPSDVDAAEAAEFVSAARMTRYHRADCLLVLGKPFTPSPRRVHEAAGRRPCEACRP